MFLAIMRCPGNTTPGNTIRDPHCNKVESVSMSLRCPSLRDSTNGCRHVATAANAATNVAGTIVAVTLRRSLSQAARSDPALGDGSSDSSDVDEDLDLWSYYQVRLVRGSREYLAMVDTSQTLLDERNALKVSTCALCVGFVNVLRKLRRRL
jgi:hypothetical protein